MSSYGPPGSGQPDDPYNQQPQYGGYPSPTSGPGGYPPPPSGYPPPPGDPYGQPPMSDGGYPPPPPPTAQWGQPGPVGYPPAPGMPGAPVPPRRSGGGGKIALIIGLVVLLLLCLCGGGIWWFVSSVEDESDPVTQPSASASVSPTDDASPSASASPSATASPSSTSSSATFAKGDCVVNDGTAEDATLRKVPCGPDTYEVLSRIPFTTDGEKCKTDAVFGAPDSDANYTHDNPIDAADYVLCLKKR